jgi:hypothetical protein
MKMPRWFFPELRRRLFGHRPPGAATRLQVRNVTRRTQLASRLELADRGPSRAKGLLGRKSLARGEGMWIVPCESVHTFGMQFPIDLIYLDRKHCIRKVRHSVAPWRLSACFSAHSVIELPAGTARETRSESGDMVEFGPTAGSQIHNS